MAGNSNAGRKPLLNEELIEEICSVIRAGNYAKTAIDYVGISESSFYNWINRAEAELARMEEEGDDEPLESEEIYLQFLASFKKADSAAKVRNVAIINDAARTHWQAAAWYLERRDPENWGRKKIDVSANVNHTGGTKNETDHNVIIDEEEKELLEKLFWKDRAAALGKDFDEDADAEDLETQMGSDGEE